MIWTESYLLPTYSSLEAWRQQHWRKQQVPEDFFRQTHNWSVENYLAISISGINTISFWNPSQCHWWEGSVTPHLESDAPGSIVTGRANHAGFDGWMKPRKFIIHNGRLNENWLIHIVNNSKRPQVPGGGQHIPEKGSDRTRSAKNIWDWSGCQSETTLAIRMVM